MVFEQTLDRAGPLAGDLVEAVRKTLPELRDPPERTRAFTTALVTEAKQAGVQTAVTDKTSGTVKWFSDTRGYGFIKSDGGGDLYVYYKDIMGTGFRTLPDGARVKFAEVKDQRGLRAVDVEPVDS